MWASLQLTLSQTTMSASSNSPPLRYLLFGTELYAIPILRPLQAAIRAAGGELRWFLQGQDAAAHLQADESFLDSAGAVRRYRPDAVLCAANWVPEFFPGIKVQVFHGFNVEKRGSGRGHFRMRGMFDLYCTQGPDTTLPFRQLADELGYFRVVETGWPKLDPLFSGEDPVADGIRAAAQGRRIIGFGSTFTERLSCAPALAGKIAELVSSGTYYWALTLHPRSAPELFAQYRALQGANACFVEPTSMLSLLRAADVLLADTSSILSEFAVLRRPVVTFRNQAPKPHMLDIDSVEALPAALQRALKPDSEWQQRIDRYADAIHPQRDGRSSERVLAATDEFIRSGRGGLRRKPFNFLRSLQSRARLSYFWP